MQFRRLLLRVVFISLAAAALVGAAGILFASHQVTGRVAGTCVATAAAALLMLWVANHLEKDPTATTGAMAAALIAIEYLLVLVVIWDFVPADLLRESQVDMTMWFLAATGVPAIVFVHLMKKPKTRVMARVGIPLCAADFVLLLCGTLADLHPPHADRFFGLGGFLALFGILAVLALAGAGTGDKRHWRWVGVIASTAGMAIGSYGILTNVREESLLLAMILTVAVVVAHANLMMLCTLRPNQQWLRWATIGFAALTGMFIDIVQAMQSHSKMDTELPSRLAGACAILAGCGTIAMLVLAKLNRKVAAATTAAAAGISQLREIALACPLCGKKQTLPVGESQCADCGLVIAVRLDDPKCKICGYSLLMLKSDRCPECGTGVAGNAATLPQPC